MEGSQNLEEKSGIGARRVSVNLTISWCVYVRENVFGISNLLIYNYQKQFSKFGQLVKVK